MEPTSLNFVQVDSNTGIKEFELIQGDITELEKPVDILCFSAFEGDYEPTESSIIGQLTRKGVNVEEISRNPPIDFRQSLGVWGSPELKSTHFKRFICVEIIGSTNSFEESVRNLFAVVSTLEIQGQKNETIAIPLLGTGDQNLDYVSVIPSLLNISLDFLKYSRFLKKIHFVVYNPKKAQQLSLEMDRILGRVKVVRPRGDLAEFLIADLNKHLDELIKHHNTQSTLDDFKRIINSEFRYFEFSAIARKVIELIINDLHPAQKKSADLCKRIDSLTEKGIAQWIVSYLHTIRVLGNEGVHDKEKSARQPSNLNEKDLEIGMYCMVRILDFYINQKK